MKNLNFGNKSVKIGSKPKTLWTKIEILVKILILIQAEILVEYLTLEHGNGRRNFSQKSNFLEKIESLVENENFGRSGFCSAPTLFSINRNQFTKIGPN